MSDPRSSVDFGALDQLLEMTGGDQGFLDDLISTYVEDGLGQLAALRDAAAGGRVDQLVRPAHSLKSNSASVGASGLMELCRALEGDARTGLVIGAPDRVATIAAEFDLVRAALALPRPGS